MIRSKLVYKIIKKKKISYEREPESFYIIERQSRIFWVMANVLFPKGVASLSDIPGTRVA